MQDPKGDDEVNHIRRNRGKHFRLWQKGKAAGMLSICCAMLLLVLAVAVPSADAAASSEPSGQSVTAEKHRKTDAMPWNGNRRIQPARQLPPDGTYRRYQTAMEQAAGWKTRLPARNFRWSGAMETICIQLQTAPAGQGCIPQYFS